MRRRVTIFAVAITVLILIALTMNSVSLESKAKVKLNPSDAAKVKLNPSDAAKVALNPAESTTFSTERALNELIYDDDTAENAYVWVSAGNGFAVRFTPLSYPVDILTARICFEPDWPDSNHEEFAVYVYDDDGPGGEPGTCLGGPIYHTATAWGWCDVDISGPGITIENGDFYILYKQLTDDPDCEGLCVDYSLPQYGRSWDYFGGSWSLWDDENYMIRCVVDVDGTTTEVSIEDASAPPGGTVTVPINIAGVANMCGANIWLNYNKDVVIVDSVSDGDLVPLTYNIDNTAGVTKMVWDTTSGMTGDFVFAYVTLKAVGNPGDTCLLDLDVKELYDCNLVEIPRTVVDGTFSVYAKPDLNVTEITLNCGYLFANESNEICAKIENIDDGDASAFNVSFVVDGFSTEVRISGLAAGANTTVCINDTTIRTAGVSLTITVTADCDGEVSESDETNNVLTLDTTVVNNGYKGKRYTGGSDINTWDTFELKGGNLIYSLGDSYYLSSSTNPDWTEYNAGWTTGGLPIPGTATIETARLFVPYTWDKTGVMPAYAAMSFNGNLQTLDAYYSDEKGWGTSYPYGMLVYDVTADFETSGNAATLTNSYPGGGGVSMRGMLLVVVYADASEPKRTILMNEEFDLLYGGASKCTTPEEATAYAPFGTIDTTGVQQATLITVAPGAGPDEGDLGFNTHMWYNVWNFVGTGTPTPQIGIAETDVTTYLQAADNEAYFRSSADYMEASNAFLILEKEVPCPAKYAVYQAKVIDPEKHLNKLRALRDKKLDDGYVDRYYDYSPALTLVLSRADSDLVKDGAQLVSRYSILVGMHVQGMDVNERITRQDAEEALSFTDRLKREVMKNRDAIGADTEAIIDFIDEFEGHVKASEGKTFSDALKSSIYYED